MIVDEEAPREGWGGDITASEVLDRLDGFAPRLLDFLDLAPAWRCWSLYDPPPLAAWSRNRIGLIGDAAHPVLPFLAQGGAMAIEDAETLAGLLSRCDLSVAEALRAFDAVRRPRVLAVQQASAANGRIYHLAGPAAWARNAALLMAPGGVLLSRYDWLYRWNGDGAAVAPTPDGATSPSGVVRVE